MLILKIAVFSPLRQLFDYLPPKGSVESQLLPGIRVRIPFGTKEIIGILVATANQSALPENKLKTAIALLDDIPIITPKFFRLLEWASHYYQHSLGDVFNNALPTWIRQGRSTQEITALKPSSPLVKANDIILTSAQKNAIDAINATNNSFQPFLLFGVTGSGKTEVYLRAMENVLNKNQNALILVPEINLTPQFIKRIEQRFNHPIAVLHSHLTDKQRFETWNKAQNGLTPIILGTRSAIFTPIPNLGLIIIDEEHDASFKQQEGFRYSARDLALVRAQMENIPIVLGSATPSLETLLNVKKQRYQSLVLSERATGAAVPKFHILDMRNKAVKQGISEELLLQIRKHLANNNQVLVFLNRRGFAPVLICQDCGWIAECRRCDTRLTLHQGSQQLICHHCTTHYSIFKKCGACQSTQLIPVGAGTERIEQLLQAEFPDTSIIRVDRDTTRKKKAMEDVIEKIDASNACILVGTQMLAKGHHFPNVTLVAVINMDSAMLSSDFRATEKMAQLLIQVAGRAGRAEKAGEVVIQTYHPDHELLNCLVKQGYADFAELTLAQRDLVKLPPLSYQALLRAEATKIELPNQFLTAAKQLITKELAPNCETWGPVPALIAKRAGKHRAQLLLQSDNRQQLQKLLAELVPQLGSLASAKKVKWSIDVDPIESC